MTKNRKKIIFYVLTSIFLAFLLLTVVVSLFPVSFVDLEFSEEVQEHQYPFLDLMMKAISWPGYTPQSPIIVLSISLFFLVFKRKKEALYTALTLLSGVVSHSLKILVDRPRPTDDLVRIIEKANHQSFPSGHVLFYIIFFGFLIVLMNRLKEINRTLRITVMVIAAFFILTVPFSRIYLGAHWFTDVLASALLGILGLFAISYFYLNGPTKHS